MLKTIKVMLGGVVLAVLMTPALFAQEAEIRGTISSQIEAFKADDFEQAFTYATPTLQRLFQTPQNFQRMVTNGYPMVWRPAEVQYLELEETQGTFFQKVQITDAKGVSHLLRYRMQLTANGWRIAGVEILQMPGATA